MVIVFDWLGIVLGAAACASSLLLFVRLKAVPSNNAIARSFGTLLTQVEAQESRVAVVTRDFRTLESDVEDMLERATKKIQRANATKTNAVRAERNQPPNPSNGVAPPGGPVDWDVEARNLEDALRDGRASWR